MSAAMTAIRLDRSEPDAGNGFQAASAHLIVASHARLLRRDLLPHGEPTDLAQRLYHAPFVVLISDQRPAVSALVVGWPSRRSARRSSPPAHRTGAWKKRPCRMCSAPSRPSSCPPLQYRSAAA
jgi:hypothetical protein